MHIFLFDLFIFIYLYHIFIFISIFIPIWLCMFIFIFISIYIYTQIYPILPKKRGPLQNRRNEEDSKTNSLAWKSISDSGKKSSPLWYWWDAPSKVELFNGVFCNTSQQQKLCKKNLIWYVFDMDLQFQSWRLVEIGGFWIDFNDGGQRKKKHVWNQHLPGSSKRCWMHAGKHQFLGWKKTAP